MNLENIVLELMDRIKILEEKMKVLEASTIQENNVMPDVEDGKNVSLTQRARDYIMGCKRMASESEPGSKLILRCRDIQKDLGVTNRAPCICQAMYDCMGPDDEVIEAPASGKSTTVTIAYDLSYLESFEEQNEKEHNSNDESREITLRQLRTGFEDYFNRKKPNYKYPGPLFGMAFYVTKNNIGVTLEEVISGKVSLEEYAEILYNYFYKMNTRTATVRMSAYKDAMKNLLEYVRDYHLENCKIIMR